MAGRLPRVSLVGAPNTGKSTLFNRMVGQASLAAFRPRALVSPMAGTTRDRLEGVAEWEGSRFALVDTGGVYGLDEALLSAMTAGKRASNAIERGVEAQVLNAVRDSSVVLFLVDGQGGLSLIDETLAPVLRRLHRQPDAPDVLLIANKLDTPLLLERSGYMADFWGLGLGEPLPVSAYHGRGMDDVMAAILGRLPAVTDEADADGRAHAEEVEAERAWHAAKEAEEEGAWAAFESKQATVGAAVAPQGRTAGESIAAGALGDVEYEGYEEYEEGAEEAEYYDERALYEVEGEERTATGTADGAAAEAELLTGAQALEAEMLADAGGGFYGGPASLEAKLAVVGRPNVGKSSLLNRLLGEERAVVHHEAGTTRDAVSARFPWRGKPWIVADTAGIRKPSAGGEEREELDRMAVRRAKQMITSCHVSLLLFDAAQGLVRADMQVAHLVVEQQKSCVIVANKVDLLSLAAREQLKGMLAERLPMLWWAPVVLTSALHGGGIDQAMDLANEAARWRNYRVPRRRLNELFRRAQLLRPLPLVRAGAGETRGRLRILYVLQAFTEAPTFVFHLNRGDAELHPSNMQWFENTIRSQWPFTATPLRIVMRSRDVRKRRRDKEKPRSPGHREGSRVRRKGKEGERDTTAQPGSPVFERMYDSRIARRKRKADGDDA